MVSIRRLFIVLLCVAAGVLYESLVWFGWGAMMPRFPTPYAVPIFDVPFALVAVGVAYLCLERHRLRQDARSAGMGTTLWLTALLALAHVFTQPDYPANPGVNPGIAPYFCFLSYFAGLVGIGLAAHCGERSFPLTGRGRLAIGAGIVVLSGALMVVVLQVRPILPPVAGGRFTPFGLGAGYFVLFTAGLWALSGGLRRYADGAILFRYGARDRVLSAMSRAGAISDTLVSGLALPLGQGASGVSVAERRAVSSSLLEDDAAVPFPRDVVTRMRGEGLRSVLAIPLAGQTGEVYGALSVFYLRPHDFTPGDVELLSAFGTQASVAIENGRSFDALGRRARHDEQLHDFAQHLLQITDEDEIREIGRASCR